MRAARVQISLAVTTAIFALLACKAPHGGRVTDGDAGLAEVGRHRIVCLTPSATEVITALGASAEIVGVDRYSVYPEEVQHLPKVGDFLSPNVEAILALTPDIVVGDQVQAGLAPKLEEAGIKVVFVRMEKVSDVKHALARVGATLGRSPLRARVTEGALLSYDAALVMLEGESRLARVGAGGDAGPQPPAPRVLIVVDRQPGGLAGIYAAGPGTFLDEIVTLAGGENALARSPVAYSSLAAEHVVALAPDVIIEVGPAVDETRARADWAALSSVPAVKTGRVYALAEPALLAPTPRTPGVATRRVVPLLWPPPSPR